MISDNPPPTQEVVISVEGIGVSSLTHVTVWDVDEATGVKTPKGGRPKGSTNAYKREIYFKYKQCVHSISQDYVSLLAMKSIEHK